MANADPPPEPKSKRELVHRAWENAWSEAWHKAGAFERDSRWAAMIAERSAGSKNRDRLLQAELAKEFLARVVEQARAKGLTSNEHFTVDGTLLEAWASAKSFKPKDDKQLPPPYDPGNPTVNFRGERRSNETHESKTDSEALLARKGPGKESKLSYSGNLLVTIAMD